jgi:NifU-like protein
LQDANAAGVGVNLTCGSTVRFLLRIEEHGRIADAAFRSNGCGYSRAAADVLAGWITGKDLADLHGLDERELRRVIQTELGKIPATNAACVGCAASAVRDAFADLRTRRIDDFRGEKALICTCFGVTDERIESLIAGSSLTSVEQVTAICNAGSGCGSCRMLIQEMLDSVL